MKSGPSLLVAALLLVAVVASAAAGALALGIVPPLTGLGPTPTPTGSPAATASLAPTASPTAPAPASPTPEPSPTDTPTDQPGPTPGGTYIVQEGDTLFSIGLLFGVPWELIAQANGLEEPYYIYPEQPLIIPAPDATSDPCAAFYIVQSGDTFYDIAYELGVSATALEAANPQITDINAIRAGDRLNVPAGPDCPSPSPSAASPSP